MPLLSCAGTDNNDNSSQLTRPRKGAGTCKPADVADVGLAADELLGAAEIAQLQHVACRVHQQVLHGTQSTSQQLSCTMSLCSLSGWESGNRVRKHDAA